MPARVLRANMTLVIFSETWSMCEFAMLFQDKRPGILTIEGFRSYGFIE